MICQPANGVCVLCGRVVPDSIAIQCVEIQQDGLGDRVAEFLASVGITKDRAQAVAQAVGLEDCGCAERQQRLNELGYRLGIGEPPDFNDPPPEPQSTS